MTSDVYPIPGPWRGQLAIIARPRGGDWLVDELTAASRNGIHVLVSLLEPAENTQLGLEHESIEAHQLGLDFYSFPIPDRSIPSSVAPFLDLCQSLTAALESGKSVAIHCRQSVGRSGMLAAALLIGAGTPLPRALHAISNSRGLDVPETPAQLAWLEHLPKPLAIA